MLPPDDHLHTEWSWDAPRGSMERTCARALQLGVPSVAFTDHADFTSWVDTRAGTGVPSALRKRVSSDGMFHPPPLDLEGYLASLEHCRQAFPTLRILSGVELGEPHWHREQSAELLRRGGFDRVLISMHSALADDGRIIQIRDAYRDRAPDEVVREYLEAAAVMIESSDVGAVLAHIDYPVRAWPSHAGPYSPERFEEELRGVLRVLARSGRALEVNTRLPLDARIVRWWRQEGGKLVSFGSDAHDPLAVARGFADATAMVAASGFRPAPDPHDLWTPD
jgi:histidinol-phosphatase (PHP family)